MKLEFIDEESISLEPERERDKEQLEKLLNLKDYMLISKVFNYDRTGPFPKLIGITYQIVPKDRGK